MSNNSSAAPQVYYRRYNLSENSMKKVVIIGGSVMMNVLFLLIFIVNISDQEWHNEKLIAFCISTAGLVIFSTVLISYGIYHIRRGNQNTASSPVNIAVERGNENELPPTYEDIMGKLPSYDSYSKSTSKQIKDNENTQCVVHI